MKKKTIIAIITVALICASVIAIRAISDKNENGWNGEYSEEETTVCETTSEKAPKPDKSSNEEGQNVYCTLLIDPSGKIDDSLIEQVKVGMTMHEVISIIGKAQREIGDGAFVLQWDLKSGDIFQMTFSNPVREKNSYASEGMRVISSKTQSEEDNWVDIELSGDESWEDYCLPKQ